MAILASVVAGLLRIVPHPPNFSGVGALGIFGGARLRLAQALLLPACVLLISDFGLWTLTGFDGKYSPMHLSRVYVYAAFFIYVAIGRCLCREHSLKRTALAALLGGLQFFIVTNFCTWLFQPWEPGYDLIPSPFRYSRDLSGLEACFAYALPFYQSELPYVHAPFMLFTDFRLSLFWICAGDVVFATAYAALFGWLTARRAEILAAPVPVADA